MDVCHAPSVPPPPPFPKRYAEKRPPHICTSGLFFSHSGSCQPHAFCGPWRFAPPPVIYRMFFPCAHLNSNYSFPFVSWRFFCFLFPRELGPVVSFWLNDWIKTLLIVSIPLWFFVTRLACFLSPFPSFCYWSHRYCPFLRSLSSLNSVPLTGRSAHKPPFLKGNIR